MLMMALENGLESKKIIFYIMALKGMYLYLIKTMRSKKVSDWLTEISITQELIVCCHV